MALPLLTLSWPRHPQRLSPLLDRDALVVTRNVEWGQLLLGFEQAQRYALCDARSGEQLALLAEETTGLSGAVGRQLLRGRRGFTATLLDPASGDVIMKVERPAWLISSHATVSDGDGAVIGEVLGRWSPTSRDYDLYDADRRQFASIRAGFLAWDFSLQDEDGGTLAVIDRNFQGFGKELFTDAGRYALLFGEGIDRSAGAIEAGEQQGRIAASSAASDSKALGRRPESDPAHELHVARPLTLRERMLALACAISVDYDYFSQRSQGGGGGWLPFGMGMPMPVPMPVPGGSEAEGGDSEAGGGGEGAPPPGGVSTDPSDYELDLGEEDEPRADDGQQGQQQGQQEEADPWSDSGFQGPSNSGGEWLPGDNKGSETEANSGWGGWGWGGDDGKSDDDSNDGGDDDGGDGGGWFGGDDDGGDDGGFGDFLGDIFGGGDD